MFDIIIRFLWGLFLRFLKILPVAVSDSSSRANLDSLRKIIKHNQQFFINYQFVASKKHQKLKEKFCFIENLQQNDHSNIQKHDLEELQKLCQDLTFYLNENFRFACNSNFEYLKKFFTYKSFKINKPRICLKAVRKGAILTLHRDLRNSVHEEQEFSANLNTAFEIINETGKHFICNDLPRSIKEGKYVNPRIFDKEVLARYKISGPLSNLGYRFFGKNDFNWNTHWRRNGDIRPKPENCYKSTLVIPLILSNYENNLSEVLREHYGINQKNQLLIFGYLCLDHPNIDYFVNQEDIDTGYIFANILSIYLIKMSEFTAHSKVYQNTLKLLSKNNLDCDVSIFG